MARPLLVCILIAFGFLAPGCIFDPVSEIAAIPLRQSCYKERDCKNAGSNCVAYSMVLYDELFDCNFLGNNPNGETSGLYCDPLILAWDCSFASASCFAGCNADPN